MILYALFLLSTSCISGHLLPWSSGPCTHKASCLFLSPRRPHISPQTAETPYKEQDDLIQSEGVISHLILRRCTSVITRSFTATSLVSFSSARLSPSDLGSVSSCRPLPPSASPAPPVSETPASPLSLHRPPLHRLLARSSPALN